MYKSAVDALNKYSPQYLEPLSALLFSSAMLDETMSLLQIRGDVLILGGAAFAIGFEQHQTPASIQGLQSRHEYRP